MSLPRRVLPFRWRRRETSKRRQARNGRSRDLYVHGSRRSHIRRGRSSRDGGKLAQALERFCFDVGVKAVSMGIHCDDGDEVLRLQAPHGFRDAKLFEEIHSVHARYLVRIELSRAAYGIQVD